MGMVVIGAVFVDIKGYPTSAFIPTGRNAGRVEQIHGGVGRNVGRTSQTASFAPPLSVSWTTAEPAWMLCAS